MKLKALIILFSIVSIFLTPNVVLAHELVPKEALQYIKENPDATVEEIQLFMEEKAPGYSKKFTSKQEAITTITNRKSSFLDTIKDFIVLGFKHILGGIDHILFILSLLLTFVSIKEMLKLTGAFTVAHSLTVILAGANILTVSSRIVEPLIAFSIAYVAITTVLVKDKLSFMKSKFAPCAVFFFGLFHGLGFAGILQDVQIPKERFFTSLISFNIGIELGQIAIIALIVPVIYLLRKKKWYGTFIKVIAVLISIVAIYWGIERIIFS